MSRSSSFFEHCAENSSLRKRTVFRSSASAHRRKRWVSTCRTTHAAALQASVSASASSVVISNAEVTLVSVRTMLSSWMTKKAITVEKRQVESSRAALSSRRLSRTAQALLPKSSQTTDDLEAILRRIVILNPKTIACMIQATKESREALQELTPCQISLRDFQARCGGNVDSKLVYKIVKEAVGQCDDYVEFYSRSPPFYPTMRFSGQTLPPFASYDDDVDLQNLSDNYWNAELAIESIHRQAPPDCKIDPGFSSECISILCHAFEVGETTSPIGVNFFTVRPEGSV